MKGIEKIHTLYFFIPPQPYKKMVLVMIDSEFNIDSDPTFKDFLDARNIRERTRENYKYHLKNYCQITDKTPTQLIEEAEEEEDSGIRLRKRKIKRYLAKFKEDYTERGYSENHIKIGLTSVRTFYRAFEIQLPQLTLKTKNEEVFESIEELPTTEEIKKALEYASPTYKAIILLMVSSGMGRAEIISLTVQDFVNSISDYFDKPLTIPLDIERISQILDRINAPVATWKIRRIKTSGKYTTFSTPESVFAIINYLEKQPPESMNRKLFVPRRYSPKGVKMDNIYKKAVASFSSLDPSAFSATFQRINKKCGFGKQKGHSKFRSHSLRKFFASQLMKTSIGQLNTDWLLGHRMKNQVQAAYFLKDPQHLRLKYREVMDAVTITGKVEVRVVTDERLQELERKIEDVNKTKKILEDIMGDKRVLEELSKR
jgi:integrase